MASSRSKKGCFWKVSLACPVEAINKMPKNAKFEEGVPIGKYAVAFSMVDQSLSCKMSFSNPELSLRA